MHEIDRILFACRALLESGRRGLLVTIVGTRGSTYRRAGARAVIGEDGSIAGMISGGCLERDLVERAHLWLEEGTPRIHTYDATDDVIFGLGLGCRGTIEMLVEPFDAARPPRLLREFSWNGRQPVTWTTELDGRTLLVERIAPQRSLLVFGGGSDVGPLAQLARAAGWEATTIAPPEFDVDLAQHDAAVIMTHNYLHDLTLLGKLLPGNLAYVGLLGPRRRADELLAQLDHVTPEQAARLHSPIGLDLGGETPEDIALSIVAEVQAVLNKRDGRSLNQRRDPLHAPPAATDPVPCR